MIERSSTVFSFSFITITATGFAVTIAQILMLRELLVLFFGNEISTGIIFAAWLIWTALGSGFAARWALRFTPRETILGLILTTLALILPLVVLFIRAARIFWSIPAGEILTIGNMLSISFTATGLFCPFAGALFGLCWASQRQGNQRGQPLVIYLGEALGATLGGLVFYFVFLPNLRALTAALITSALLLIAAGWILRPRHFRAEKRLPGVIWMLVSFLIVLATIFGSFLEKKSRHWQWGSDLAIVFDTPHRNVAIIRKQQQVSVFGNGLWLFSEPDALSAEHAVHPALLQHPQPERILLLGGGIAGHLVEVLKHPGVVSLDYVEPDPRFRAACEPYLSSAVQRSLKHDSVRIFYQDASHFMRYHNESYDVILMNMGDPINAQMNRFYAEEFYYQVKKHLRPAGIFSFAVSGGQDMLGHAQARFLGSIQRTLHQVFNDILIYPGNHTRFFACEKPGILTSNYLILTDRISERKLALTHVREDTLRDTLSPFRLDYLGALLEEIKEPRINRDFAPVCFLHTLMLWTVQWHPALEQIFSRLASLSAPKFWIGVTVIVMIILIFFWTGRVRFKAAVGLSVMGVGAIEMALVVILLLTFQILEGFVYRQLALLIAFYMAGLGIGAGCVSGWKLYRPSKWPAVHYFIGVQALISLFPLLLLLLFNLIHGEYRYGLSSVFIGWIFSGLSLSAGVLGGIHFSLAVYAFALIEVPSEKIGGELYAMDLIGSAGGVLIVTLFVVPIFGIMNTLILLSLLSFVCVLILMRRP
ncbi:hypothetical protein ACFL9U_02220 [Thermodesulfobacteriota bacterium]